MRLPTSAIESRRRRGWAIRRYRTPTARSGHAVEYLFAACGIIDAAYKLLGDVPLGAAAGSLPISFPADLLALKLFIGHVLELAKGPFSFAGGAKKGRPKEIARMNFMLRTIEVIPPDLWEKGRRFEREFADLHAIVFFAETEMNELSYGRVRDRHHQVASVTARRVVRRRGRGRASLPEHGRPPKNPQNG